MSCAPAGFAAKEHVSSITAPADAMGLTTIMAHLVALKSQMDTLQRGQDKVHQSVVDVQKEIRPLLLPALGAARLQAASDQSGNGKSVIEPAKLLPGTAVVEGVPQSYTGSEQVDFVEPPPAQIDAEENELLETVSGMSRSRGSVMASEALKAHNDTKSLAHLITVAEAEEMKAFNDSRRTLTEKMKDASKDSVELVIDSFIGIMIFSNALFIGLSIDNAGDDAADNLLFVVVDVFYTCIFMGELIVKIRMNGVWGHFCGIRSGFGIMSNWFDFLIVAVDTVQLVMRLFFPLAMLELEKAPSSSLFRVIRLLRLGRVLRILKIDAVKDLVNMTSGLIGGMSTLMWAGILFGIAVYVFALVFRETIGKEETVEGVTDYFDTVPRAIYTLWRCSFGDCSTAAGMPIFELVEREFGWIYAGIYCTFIYFFTVGLFNVISAIFVESTLSAATMQDLRDKQARLMDDTLWATRISQLIKVIMKHTLPETEVHALSEHLDQIRAIDVGPSDFKNIVSDEEAIRALDDLDISRDDHRYLSDILDPDNGGSVTIIDVVDGLKRLRGEPRRSDIVAVDLMVRSIQTNVNALMDGQDKIKQNIRDLSSLMAKSYRRTVLK